MFSPNIQIDVDGNDPGEGGRYLPVVEGGEIEHVPGVLVGAEHHHSTVQCSAVQYSTVQYSTVQYSTVHMLAEPGHQVAAGAVPRPEPVLGARGVPPHSGH